MLQHLSRSEKFRRAAALFVCFFAMAASAAAQGVTSFAGNAQHTAIYQPAARDLNSTRWSTSIILNNTGAFAHYGAPLITASNTVVVPVKTTSTGFQVNVFNGNDGTAKYTLTTDYIIPSHNWIPVYQPVLANNGSGGVRLYYPGAGGTVYFIDNPDSSSPGAPTRRVFYTDLATYTNNASGYNGTIFINTPITADSSGNIFFGFRVQGTAPNPLNTTQSGFARIDPNGTSIYVLAGTAAGDGSIQRDSHNSAPALSNDGSTLYVVVKSGSIETYGYLLGLNATTLATKYKVFLKDPRNSHANNARITDDSTASPTVAPDGDVYFGILGNPDNGSRGFLLHFTGDLTVEKTPGGFGWDYTPAIVPASMAPLYTGTSLYLIFSKYNNYAISDGNGVNRIALLDPNATQIDPHTSASGLVEMREVLTVIGPTPDAEYPSVPNAVREWCINTAAVNPATFSIFTPSEDGHLYRWNLANNSLSETVALSAGIGEPYVPSAIGPDGTVYTLNGGTMFALGEVPGVLATLTSSNPDLRTAVAGQTLTFTATVSNTSGSGSVPTGDVTFYDTIYYLSGSTLNSSTSLLATVPLNGGVAAFSTSSLGAGNHFIKAVYGGDPSFSPTNVMMVENVHAFASTTALTASPSPSAPGQSVTFTATVSPVPPGSAVPTGMVTFQEGDTVLAQVVLGAGGTAAFSTSSLSLGTHTLTAFYASDSVYASSNGSVTHQVATNGITTTSVTSTPNPSVYGQTVTFTALVSSGSGTPTGTVTFKEGTTTLTPTPVPVDGTGRAQYTTSTLSVGSHTITAVFTGTSPWLNSSGDDSASPQMVNRIATTIALTSSADPATVKTPVTFTATVSAVAPGTGIPTGNVTFFDKGKVLGQSTLDASGKASYTTSTLTQGAHQISASYAGSTNYAASSSPNLVENIKK
jgi:uncharacterized repeat protein (TIGR01451 family)